MDSFFFYHIPNRVGMWNCLFWKRRETSAPIEKPFRAKTRTTNELNPHMTTPSVFEPSSQRQAARAFSPLGNAQLLSNSSQDDPSESSAFGPIPLFRNYTGNGYNLPVQTFLGLFGWTSISYDWLMVLKATINQSQVPLVHPNDPRNRWAESL